MPYLRKVQLERAIVAPSIYGEFPHEVTEVGLVLERAVKAEVEQFLREYTKFLGIAEFEKHFRIDLYFDHNNVYVIEVNVEVADGWGVALNLGRAAGFSPPESQVFPDAFPTFSGDLRKTEFRLAIDEFARLGHTATMCEQKERVVDPFDNKIYLARFAKVWTGKQAHVPALYHCGNAKWEDIPEDVYLKFAEKFCPEAIKTRYSAKPRCELGRAKQMRKLFAEGGAVAQERVSPFQTEVGEHVQAVVMCAGSQVVTGYIQVASNGRHVINDKNTKKGPLLFL